MLSLLVVAALADGRALPGEGTFTLAAPPSAAPGALVELVLTGPQVGRATLLSAASVGGRVVRRQAMGGAVIELAAPLGWAAAAEHRGETRFRVRMPASDRAWQVVLVAGPARLASNPVLVRADGAARAVAPTPVAASVVGRADGAAPVPGPADAAAPAASGDAAAPGAAAGAPSAAPDGRAPAAPTAGGVSVGRSGRAETGDTADR